MAHTWWDQYGTEYGFIEYTDNRNYLGEGHSYDFEIWTKSSSYTCEIKIVFTKAKVEQVIYNGKAGSFHWEPDIGLAIYEPDNQYLNYEIRYKIYNSSRVVLGEGTNYSSSIVKVPPEIVSWTITDAKGWYNTIGTYLQGQSLIQVKATIKTLYAAEPQYCRMRLRCNNVYTATLESSEFTKTGTDTYTVTVSLPPSDYGGTVVSFRCYDTRGNDAFVNEGIMVAEYAPPDAIITSLYRCTSDGTAKYDGSYACAVFNISCSSFPESVQNSFSYRIKYAASDSTSPTYTNRVTGSGLSVTGAKVIFWVNTEKEYAVELEVTDRIATTGSTIKYVLKVAPLLDIDRDNNAFGIGMMAGDPNTIQFGQKAFFPKGTDQPLHNINLLDNSDFTRVVKQTPLVSGFPFDRWHSNSSLTIQNDTCVTIPSGGSMWQCLSIRDTETPKQICWNYSVGDGIMDIDRYEYYTLAAMTTAGEIYFISGRPVDGVSSTHLKMSSTSSLLTLTLYEGSYVWAALYYGKYHLGNLPEYHAKGYSEELRACMRYSQMVETVSVPARVVSTTIYVYYPLKVPMRLNVPTLVPLVPDDEARISFMSNQMSGYVAGQGDFALEGSHSISEINVYYAYGGNILEVTFPFDIPLESEDGVYRRRQAGMASFCGIHTLGPAWRLDATI